MNPTTEPHQADLLYSEAEEDLRAAVRALLTDRNDPARVAVRAEEGAPYDAGLWKALAADMGVAGLLVPEELGGQGASHREAAVVLEELGRAIAPAPYLTSAVVATEVLLACGTGGSAASSLLGDLASGRRTAALVVPFATGPEALRLPGGTACMVTAVADAATADVLLVPSTAGLYAVERAEAGVDVAPLVPFDLTRPLATVTLTEEAAAAATPLAGAETALAAVRQGLTAGAGLLASEQLGLAEWCLEETVRYTKERHQFNRPVGSFQALKHRMAQLWLEVVSARAAARNAADSLAAGSPDAPLAAALAQAYCARVAVHAAEECVQLHGGIGMTWEHPAHLYLKRAKADSIALGAPGAHRETVGRLAGLPTPA
ncbi:acyl-CoA dehydrogenase family protein [Streptomyces candidus]|uniref:Alkylation response protein AidB-like acyl-CoA dehydrogenase n=1 Tax=Streptomyces candidus TaxID=67283 RepID=A0A7X0HJG1_9ACTN|nr:acyl-CoA dehydrogenase family protein [Streptomyces candidus]MBB6438790.1 alkylation response protein AidB-like acyl-CoA dehydrogenase [Streptomyces candidus]GHH52971.1 acyl-CoA dehydrogenase [Streptomyces candidus]